MEHAPIYRSNTRLRHAAPIPWRRTASLATAAAGIALGGIALGYHGFAYATDTVKEAAASASRSATLPFPSFSVQSVLTTEGGHPDVIGALSSALLAHIQVSPALIQSLSQPFGPFPSPLPQPRPQFQPAVELAPFAEVDLSALVPVELRPTVDAAADATMDQEAYQAAADVAEAQSEPLVAAQIDARAAITVAAAEPAALMESAPAADDVPESVPAADTPAPHAELASAEPPAIAPPPAAPATQTQASVKIAAPPATTVVAAKPEPKPTPVPQVVRKIVVPIEDEPRARAEPPVDREIPVHHPSPPPVTVAVHPAEDKHDPPPANKNRGDDAKTGADKAKPGGAKHGG